MKNLPLGMLLACAMTIQAHAYQVDTLSQCIRLSNATSKAYVYHNIRYAQADRWQEPHFVLFDQQGDYRYAGNACPQFRNQPNLNMDEDCLVLTVNSPIPLNQKTDKRYPVHVHIHGGAYQEGSGENHYTQMAEYTLREQVVSVTISYRVGAFGYQYVPVKGRYNLGLKDQLMALEWVRKYIGLWGGDADQLTLSGHSAGAQSVVYILAEPNRVPIKRAIVFSAPMGCEQSLCQAKQHTEWLTKELNGQNPLLCPADSLLSASIRCMEHHKHFLGMIWMPTGVEQMPCKTDGIQWPEDVVVTCQADDGGLFVNASKCLEPMATSVLFSRESKAYVRYLKRQGVNARYYEFDWRPQGSKYGATHCVELPLFLGELYRWDKDWCLGNVTWQELLPRRERFMDNLGDFVRTGKWTYK